MIFLLLNSTIWGPKTRVRDPLIWPDITRYPVAQPLAKLNSPPLEAEGLTKSPRCQAHGPKNHLAEGSLGTSRGRCSHDWPMMARMMANMIPWSFLKNMVPLFKKIWTKKKGWLTMIAKYRRSQDIHLQQIQVDAWKKSYHGCHKVGESYLATIDNYPIRGFIN